MLAAFNIDDAQCIELSVRTMTVMGDNVTLFIDGAMIRDFKKKTLIL